MRAVLQRVTSASVTVEGQIVGAIDTGLVVLVGVESGDTDADATYIAGKIADVRLFDAAQSDGPEQSLIETRGSALIISQFTLLGDARRGRRPSWSQAARPEDARRLYETVTTLLAARGVPVQTGIFQAEMSVTLTNDGPFTILLDSRKAF